LPIEISDSGTASILVIEEVMVPWLLLIVLDVRCSCALF